MRRPPRRRPGPLVVAGAGYLALSALAWWGVWPHPSSTTTCGCGDAALTIWVIAWPAHALAHAQNPFYSSLLFHPVGINMAPNSLGLGVAFAPITWLFGPVASLNAIDVLSPAASALAMCWLVRRWVTWTPAAFLAGLWYGFSPFVVVSLALGHPNFGLLALPPLMVGVLDQLLVRQTRRPVRTGVALGLLAAAEFFVSVEVLALLAAFTAAALVVLFGVAWHRDRPHLAARVAHGAKGLAAAGATAGILLAYPLWFFFAGPAHLVGRAWPNSPPGVVGSSIGDFVNGYLAAPLVGIMHVFGGYQGPALPTLSFLGAGALVVAVVGALVWRSDRRIWFFGGAAVVAAALSLGVRPGYWTPWRLFTHVPVLDNVVPINCTAVTVLALAIVLGVVTDRVHGALATRPRPGSAWAAVVAWTTGALVVAPVVVAMAPNLPLTVRPVTSPRWFTSPAAHRPSEVLLPYPPAFGGIQSSMAWQATAGLPFAMVGGGGPGIVPSRAGPERPGFEVLAKAALPLGPAPEPTPHNLTAIRTALTGWGVTTVVVPDEPGLPTYDRGRSVPYAVGLFTAAIGRAPVLEERAWVWKDVAHLSPSPNVSTAHFDQCTGPDAGPGARVAACVLGAGGAP